jgi:hypothetical protein
MRTLLAIVIFAGGVLAIDSTADAARKSKRDARPPYSYQPKTVDAACEDRARHEDPAGDFARYPCWAREAFARGRNINMH